MACGLPVVATDVGGTAHAVDERRDWRPRAAAGSGGRRAGHHRAARRARDRPHDGPARPGARRRGVFGCGHRGARRGALSGARAARAWRRPLAVMCGIVGKASFDGRPVDTGWLHTACELLAHRGPDGERLFTAGGGARPAVGLGHRRLKVIDLAPTADQPMDNGGCRGASPSLFIVFNGEIYNYRELRDELAAKGHVFKTALRHRSDPAPLRGARRRAASSGCAACSRFALWDATQRRLFAGARPRWARSRCTMPARRARVCVRLGAQGAACRPRVRARASTRRRSAHYLRCGTSPAPTSAFRGMRQAAAGALPDGDATAPRGATATGR